MYQGNNFSNTRQGGGRSALRNLGGGGSEQGRENMSQYTGPDARPANENLRGRQGGQNNLRSMLLGPQPNQSARDHANPNAQFNRQPGPGTSPASPPTGGQYSPPDNGAVMPAPPTGPGDPYAIPGPQPYPGHVPGEPIPHDRSAYGSPTNRRPQFRG